MQYDTKKDRLKIYKKMLRDYKIARFFNFFFWYYLDIKETTNTHHGFCWYIYKLSDDEFFLEDLIELDKLSPKPRPFAGYWFKGGELKPRIELLKKAISDTKMHIEIERLMLEK